MPNEICSRQSGIKMLQQRAAEDHGVGTGVLVQSVKLGRVLEAKAQSLSLIHI